MHIVGMRPSEITALKNADFSGQMVKDLYRSISHLVTKTLPHNKEVIFVAAQDLTLANVWRHLKASDIASALIEGNSANQSEFLAGIPEAIAHSIQRELKHLIEKRMESRLAKEAASVRRTGDVSLKIAKGDQVRHFVLKDAQFVERQMQFHRKEFQMVQAAQEGKVVRKPKPFKTSRGSKINQPIFVGLSEDKEESSKDQRG